MIMRSDTTTMYGGGQEEEDDEETLESLLDDAACRITPTHAQTQPRIVTPTDRGSEGEETNECCTSSSSLLADANDDEDEGGVGIFDPLGQDVKRRTKKKKGKKKSKMKEHGVADSDTVKASDSVKNHHSQPKTPPAADKNTNCNDMTQTPTTSATVNDSGVHSLVKQLRQIQHDAMTPSSAHGNDVNNDNADSDDNNGDDDNNNNNPLFDMGAGGQEEMLVKMLEQLMSGDTSASSTNNNNNNGANGGGGALPGNVQSLVDAMMAQMLSKEVLQKPMMEIRDKYPPWLDANSSSLSPHDLARFTQQYKYVCEVCRLYDEEYSTNNASNGTSNNNNNSETGSSETKMKIMEVMQQMQDCGQPPQDLIDSLAPKGFMDGEGMNESSLLSGILGNASNKGGEQGCPMQ